jgi:hypothetical protein
MDCSIYKLPYDKKDIIKIIDLNFNYKDVTNKYVHLIIFDSKMIQLINDINLKIIKITFDNNFNESLTNIVFPSTVKSIIFGNKFNQIIDFKLPEELEELSFGKNYDQVLENHNIPSSIISLKILNSSMNIKLNYKLFKNLDYLILDNNTNKNIINMIPNNLKYYRSFNKYCDN